MSPETTVLFVFVGETSGLSADREAQLLQFVEKVQADQGSPVKLSVRSGGRIPFFCGPEDAESLDFNVRPQVLKDVLVSVLARLKKQGYQRIVLVSEGGDLRQLRAIELACESFSWGQLMCRSGSSSVLDSKTAWSQAFSARRVSLGAKTLLDRGSLFLSQVPTLDYIKAKRPKSALVWMWWLGPYARAYLFAFVFLAFFYAIVGQVVSGWFHVD